MFNTQAFSTRSEYKIGKNNPKAGDVKVIGLDMGYSSPKCVHESGNFMFPNYVKRITGELFGSTPNDMLVYTNEKNESYIVGNFAIRSLDEDSVVSEDSLYGRNHYLHPEFRIVFETALALALWNLNTDGSNIFLQTGLPPAYIVRDEPYIRSVLAGEHKFKLEKGGEAKSFDITLTNEQIDVMTQPMGAIQSVLFNDDGSYSKHAAAIMSPNVDTLLIDGGFVTFDKFVKHGRELTSQGSNANLGMKRVLDETRKMIARDFGVNISIPAMQKVLKSGTFAVNDLITMNFEDHDVSEYFEKANNEIANVALESVKEDIVSGVKYIIMAGGTGEAWYPIFKEFVDRLPEKKRPVILLGSESSNLPGVYGVARGYYMSRVNKLRKGIE